MGVSWLRLSGGSSYKSSNCIKISNRTSYVTDSRNPNPLNYIIERVEKIDDFLIATIKYPNCTNYEGDKILVFYDMTEEELRYKTEIDPHFTSSSKLIARFAPTDKGLSFTRIACSEASWLMRQWINE